MPRVRSNTSRRSRTSGIDRTIEIIDHMVRYGAQSTTAELARALDAPTSTIYKIVEELTEHGLLVRDSSGGAALGPRLMYFGLACQDSMPFIGVANKVIRTLSAEVGESVQLCGRDDNMMVVIAMVEGPGSFVVSSRVGSRVPLNWTASGRLLTGHLSDGARRSLYARACLPSPTGRAETDPVVLAAESRLVLERRCSIQLGVSDYALACIAAPIVNPVGECVATISIVLPERRAIRNSSSYIEAVQVAAREVEGTVGWSSVDLQKAASGRRKKQRTVNV
ncbi:IclR family transcriptional regulator [Leptospira interrogans]